jgi:hypothetical protein
MILNYCDVQSEEAVGLQLDQHGWKQESPLRKLL